MSVPSYYRLQLRINAPKGGISERYNLLNPVTDYAGCYQKCLDIITLRAQILAAGCAVVNAVMSLEVPVANAADGTRIPETAYKSPILLTKVDNATPETAIEPFSKAELGIMVKFSTGIGAAENRLIRMVRGSWIAGDNVGFTGVVPIAVGGGGPFNYGAYNPAATPTVPVALGQYLSYIRDNTAMVQPTPSVSPTGFNLTPFAATATNNWVIIGTSKRAVGLSWPPVRGKKPVFA